MSIRRRLGQAGLAVAVACAALPPAQLGHAAEPAATPAAGAPPALAAPGTPAADATAQLFNGLLLPASTALIKSKQNEQVAEITIEVGTRVSAGQPLLRLVDDAERVTRDRAAAVLDRAKSELVRLQELHKREGTSAQLLEDAQTDVRVSEADLALAEIRLAERTIKAPFAGVLAERYVDPGASVQEGDPLVRVTALTPLRLEALLPEEMLSRLRGRPLVEVKLTTPDTTLIVTPRLGTVVVDAGSGTFPLHATIDNAQGRLIPGTSCTVRILAGSGGSRAAAGAGAGNTP